MNFIAGQASDTAVVQISKGYLCVKPHLRETVSWNFGNWRLNKLSVCEQININVRFILVSYCGDAEDVGLRMKKSEGMKKSSSSLCCSWKLTVRQSPSHDKNECHCRSCLHKTEILFSHSNISPASWQICFFFFFGKLPICCLNHTVTAVHCLCCCFSSWPVITRYLWFNDVATEQSNQSILSKHSPGSNFMWLFLEQGVWQLMMLVNIYNLYRGSKKLFSPPDC